MDELRDIGEQEIEEDDIPVFQKSTRKKPKRTI
jgi:hypothetical protein